MGFRFRRSVKICKGVKINVSKSGTSLSLGGAGHSVNFGSKGVRTTVGIPGTGLSYSTSTATSSGRGHKSSNSARVTSATSSFPAVSGSLAVHMNDKGQVSIFDDQGNQIVDQVILRKIRSTPQFKVLKENLEQQRQAKMTELVDNSHSENEKFIQIHTFSPSIKTQKQTQHAIEQLKPEKYKRRPYHVAPPDEAAILAQLQEEAFRTVKANFLTIKKKRQQYVNENLSVRIQQAQAEWEKGRLAYEEDVDSIEQAANEEYQRRFNEQIDYLKRIASGEESLVLAAIDEWIAGCTLPVEINVNYEYNHDEGIVLLDVDLPEIEDLPTTEIIRLASGNIKERKKTQKELNAQYATLVFGLAVFIVSNIMDITPAITNVIISGYTQRRNKNGDMQDTYIYSMKLPRSMFEHTSLKDVNPVEFCMQSENRCNQTTTGMFKAIVPFE